MSWIETARLAVEEIKKRREKIDDVLEGKEFHSFVDCEKSELSEKRAIHIHDAARLYKKRGWVQIYSTYLNRTIYLVRNEGVKVPTSDLPVYTESEVNALRGLSREEVLTLHEAKVIFKGTISNP